MENTEKLYNAKKEALDTIRSKKANHENLSKLVSISFGNSKMGKVASVSTLPVVTCPNRCNGTCGTKCYAKKLCMLRPNVLKCYATNTAIASISPTSYFKAINDTMKTVRFFRYHVSGDIMGYKYFRSMVRSALNNPHCEVLVFTKQYEIINKWIESGNTIPKNMHVLFSEWQNLKSINPYNFPTTNVYSNESEIKPNWILCNGNCLDCAIKGTHCWKAQKGQTIAFKIH